MNITQNFYFNLSSMRQLWNDVNGTSEGENNENNLDSAILSQV